nr:transposase [Bacteroides congonensis]
MSISAKKLPKKRILIGTINAKLKNITQIEHSKRRSINNSITNSLSTIIIYYFIDNKSITTTLFGFYIA